MCCPLSNMLTDDLIFIGLISHIILTSQCRCIVQILGLDRRGYWKHLIDMWMETVNKKMLKKMKVYNKTVISWILGQQHFWWTSKGSVALSLQLRATDPFSGQTKLLLSSNPVYNSILIFNNHSWTVSKLSKAAQKSILLNDPLHVG